MNTDGTRISNVGGRGYERGGLSSRLCVWFSLQRRRDRPRSRLQWVLRAAGDAALRVDAGDFVVGARHFRLCEPRFDVLHELGVLGRLDAHEVSPAAEMAGEFLRGQAAEFVLGDGERNDGAILGSQA